MFESEGVENLDSSEPAGREVSLSVMPTHTEENRGEKIYHHLKASPAPFHI